MCGKGTVSARLRLASCAQEQALQHRQAAHANCDPEATGILIVDSLFVAVEKAFVDVNELYRSRTELSVDRRNLVDRV